MFTQTHNWILEVKNIQELLNKSVSITDIAKQYQVSKQRLHQIIKRYKLEYLTKKETSLLKLKSFSHHYNHKDTLLSVKRKKFRDKKRNARINGIEFSLAFDEIHWPTLCPVLGIPLDYLSSGRQGNSPSFDRIDPTKGYTYSNTHIISFKANRIKNDSTIDELQKIYEYFKNL